MPIRGIKNNEITVGEDKDADYELIGTSGLLSTHGNLVPMPSAVQGPRVFYGARFFDQALPTLNNEAPLVRNLEEQSGRSWDWVMGGHAGALRADADGVVQKITPDELELKLTNGSVVKKELYNHFPNNRKTLSHHTHALQVGQAVKAGDLLAKSNFTDGEGRLALGNNARIGLVPFKGASMDDAVVISAAYAKRLTSEHAETFEQEKDEDLKGGKNHYVALFPKNFVGRQLEQLDADGLVKRGTILEPGDPMMLFTKPRSFNSQNADVARLSRAQRFLRRDAARVWEGEDPAEVLDIARTRDGGVKVLVRYQSPTRPGDKLVLRAGQKGTVSGIIPDEKMPRTEDGKPLDLLLNPLGLPSRVNASTFFELLLGKIAAKTGKAYTLPGYTGKGKTWLDFVESELKANNIAPEERVYDPEEDRFLDNPVTVGVGHVLKLHHLASGKMSARGSSGYSADRQPMKGGGKGGGAQRLSSLEMGVLHSSGARGVQQEAILLRGELNDDYWKALRNNRTAPKLGKPFVWQKMQVLLNGTGVNAKDLGKGRLRLTPMTEQELDRRGSVEVKNDGIVDLADFEPKPGGLFDPKMVRDQKWGHITLPFPIVNPAYEEQVRILLGLSQKEYQALLERQEGPSDKVASIGEIAAMLDNLDLPEMRARALSEIRSGKKTRRHDGVRLLRAVDGLQRAGVAPRDLIVKRVPVIPSEFRPYSVAGNTFIPGDANELYSDLIKANAVYRENVAELGAEGAAGTARYLRAAARAAYGYEDSPNPKIKARNVSGFLSKILGSNPKQSFVQSKLLAKPQDFVGRGVISPNPELGMDDIEIPEAMAWALFDPHVQRNLVSQGIPSSRARVLMRDKHPQARRALDRVMTELPVLTSRAPAWHRHSVLSVNAKITDGDNIKINPFISAGLNADYDGDTMAVHVPTLPGAIRDAKERLRPSQMLFSIRSRDETLAVPKHEQLLGLATSQLNPSEAVHKFETREMALQAYNRGEIKLQDTVEINDAAPRI